jgi:hypothetical protein
LQLVHDPGARLHHPVPVPQQLSQIPVLPSRYPNLRKPILDQQLQNMLCILAIRLLLAYPSGSDLGGVANPELERQLRQQSLEPARMPAGFHTHAHLHSLGRQIAVELLRFLAVLRSSLSTISSFGIYKRNLLEARVVIASLYLVCIFPIRSLCVSGELDRVSAGGRSQPEAH